MATAVPSVPRRAGLTPARVSALTLWAASLLVLGMADGGIPVFALLVAAYAVVLWALGTWLLPEVVPVEADPILRAAGSRTRLAVRCAVVAAAVAFVFTYTNAFAGLQTGLSVPVLTPWIQSLRAVRLAPYIGGVEWFNFAAYALIPGTILLALGARPHELGLRWPDCQTMVGTVACLLPVGSFVSWGVATGRLPSGELVLLVVHNLLSNGFSEEFLCRGMVLAHLRAFLRSDWAQLGQAVVFALLHYHPSGAEEQAAAWRSLAEDLALNVPVALAFGYLAVRSRSLLLPTCLHMFRWIP